MQRTPPKRRKVSPTRSVPVEDAPTPRTPSRIPGPARDAAKTPSERRPSFASPTKASIARHNPQLLNRPSSSGTGAEGKGKNLDDVFAKVLGEVRDTVESQPGSIDGGTQSNGSTRHGSRVPESQRSTTPRGRRLSVGGPLSAKPKRLSRSPVKRPEAPVPADTGFGALQENVNPFQKRGGLRRSPISSSQAEPEPPAPVEDSLPGVANPFKKTGLRRSPISTKPARSIEEAVAQPEISTTPTAPTPAPVAEPIIFDDIERQEELAATAPIPAEEPVLQIEEPIVLNNAPEEPVFEAEEPINSDHALKEPSFQAEEPIIPNNAPEIEEPIVAPKSAPRRSSHLAELIRHSQASVELASENPSSVQPQEDAVPTPEQASKPDVSPTNKASSNEPTPPEPASISPVPQLAEILKEVPRPSQYQRPEAIFNFGISPVKEALRSARSQQPEREEPELPPTPTQRGIADPIVTTPPSGIHDTPSKRGRKSKVLGEKLKSSPLKPRPAPPQEPAKEVRRPKEPEPEVQVQVNPKPVVKEKPRRRKSARFLVPEDPYASKKKARDDLLKELQQLQADVALANQENERLRLLQESGKRRPTAAPNPDELLDLLKRSTEQPSKPKPKPTSIFKSIGPFLPFSSRRRTQPISSSALEKPLPSHLPIALDDPLPYLEAFSPLNYTSTVVLLPPDQTSSESASTEPTLQKHNIHATHPTGLFAARLTMTVNTSNLSITSLSIPALDTNAEKELGPFVRDRASGNGKDISIICWAMGRWVEVSIKRAAFFCTIESELSTVEARAKSRSRTKKRKRAAGDEDDAEVEEDELKKTKWTRRQLLPHLGRTSMEIVSSEVELRIEWSIGFDWTGEAESVISAGARVSKSWQQADDRKILDKVPETFDKLVRERGPLGAVRSIVGLLMDGS